MEPIQTTASLQVPARVAGVARIAGHPDEVCDARPSRCVTSLYDPQLRETHIVKTTLQMRLPISTLLANPQKQRGLQRHE